MQSIVVLCSQKADLFELEASLVYLRVPGQPGLYNEALSQNQNPNQ